MVIKKMLVKGPHIQLTAYLSRENERTVLKWLGGRLPVESELLDQYEQDDLLRISGELIAQGNGTSLGVKIVKVGEGKEEDCGQFIAYGKTFCEVSENYFETLKKRFVYLDILVDGGILRFERSACGFSIEEGAENAENQVLELRAVNKTRQTRDGQRYQRIEIIPRRLRAMPATNPPKKEERV